MFGARGYGGAAFGGGVFLGQQNYNAGSLGNNFAGGLGRKKRSASQFNQNYQPRSFTTSIIDPEFEVGYDFEYALGTFTGRKK